MKVETEDEVAETVDDTFKGTSYFVCFPRIGESGVPGPIDDRRNSPTPRARRTSRTTSRSRSRRRRISLVPRVQDSEAQTNITLDTMVRDAAAQAQIASTTTVWTQSTQTEDTAANQLKTVTTDKQIQADPREIGLIKGPWIYMMPPRQWLAWMGTELLCLL